MIKRNKSIRAVEALEAVKERIENELDEVNWSREGIIKKILKIIEDQLEKEE